MKARSRSSSIPIKRFNRRIAQESTRWIAADTLRELQSAAVQARLRSKGSSSWKDLRRETITQRRGAR